MIKIHCDCGDVLDVPEDFLDGGAYSFWRFHGHPPSTIELVCSCGARHETGPKSMRQLAISSELLSRVEIGQMANRAARIWYSEHFPHGEAAA